MSVVAMTASTGDVVETNKSCMGVGAYAVDIDFCTGTRLLINDEDLANRSYHKTLSLHIR